MRLLIQLSLLLPLAAVAGCVKEDTKVLYTCTDSYRTEYDCDCDGVQNSADSMSGCGTVSPPDTGTDPHGDTATEVDADGDGVAADSDCDDLNAAINPTAAEICDSVDNNCNGSVDEGVGYAWYADADSDGYGDASWLQIACSQPARFVANAADCNDLNAGINPSAIETCDAIDNDCDGAVDDNPSDGQYWYQDADGDGYGIEDPGEEVAIVWACAAPSGYVAYDGDCNDASTAYHPNASETNCADPNDYNCDGSTGAVDADRDGYFACQECNDSNAAIKPGADEWCDGVDNDCDTRIDTTDAVDAIAWYVDADADGFGNEGTDPEYDCDQPAGYVADDTDCNDAQVDINPDGVEVCDVVEEETNEHDEDCDGLSDDDDPSTSDAIAWYDDADHDGYGVDTVPTYTCEQDVPFHSRNNRDCDDADHTTNPGAREDDDNGIDDDCDSLIDEP